MELKLFTMKKYMLYAGMLLALLALSCNEEEQFQELFSVAGSPVSVAKEGATVSFTINSTQGWTINKPADAGWITLLVAPTGKSSVEVSLIVTVNLTVNSRTATLVVTAADGRTENVVINQAANSLPAAAGTIEGLNANQCSTEGDMSVKLSVAPINAAAAYVWYKNGVEVAATPDGSYTVSTLGTATYTVAGRNIIGTGPVSPSKVVTLSLCLPDAAGPISGPSTATDCSADGVTIVLSVAPINLATSYVWYKNGAEIAGATGMSYTVPKTVGAATYTVAGKNDNGIGPVSAPKPLNIIVCPPVDVTGVTLSPTATTLTLGSTVLTAALTATIQPSNATNKTVSWSSNNTSVATVNNGTVTAVAVGNATITVTTQNNSRTATCVVTVTDWLGTVGFATNSTWVVNGKTWSDVVTATGCNKTDYDGSKADGRNNPGYTGNMFSWHAVHDYAARLCPSPWRVPMKQDFVDLDIALNGGSGNGRSNDMTSVNRYLSQWGLTWGGYLIGSNIYEQDVDRRYWTQEESNSSNGYYLYVQTTNNGAMNPQQAGNKSWGMAVRCIKD